MDWPDLSMGKYGFYVWGSYLFRCSCLFGKYSA